MMGPELSKKNGDKNGNKNGSQHALSSTGQGSIYGGSTIQGTDVPSSPTNVTDRSRLSGEGWNLRRYQREDEALWGIDFHGPGQKIKDAIAKAGNSASRFVESRLSRTGDGTAEEKPVSYFAARNPPVNDLHPPIVSTQPTSRDETRWMLQPPPSAKIMEGKERVVRSRADSNGSSRSRRIGEEPLSRQVTGKLVDAKLQSGEMFPDRPTTARKIKTPTSGRPRTQRRDTNRSHSADSSSDEELRPRARRRPPPLAIATNSTDSDNSIDGPQRPSAIHPVSSRGELSKRPSLRSKKSTSYRTRRDGSGTSPQNEEAGSQKLASTPTSDTSRPLSRLSLNTTNVDRKSPAGEESIDVHKPTLLDRENDRTTTLTVS